MRARVQIVYKNRRNTFACPLDFEELNKVLEPSILIINYCTLIINAYYIRQILEKKWEHNEAVHQLFIDIKKAYDSVRREALYNILLSLVSPRNW